MESIINDGLRQLKSRIEEIVGEVKSAGLNARSYSEFEHKLEDAVGELGRTVEKAVLENADIEKPSIEHWGMRHYWKYKGPQEYQCLFGKIEVHRSVYQANGQRTLCPLEVNAGILHHHLTPAAVEFVAYSMAHMVPAEVAEFCRRWQYLTPSETVIKQVAAQVGDHCETIAEIYDERVHKQEGSPPQDTSVVTFSRDGTAVNIRGEGWRHAQVGSVSFYGPKVGNQQGEAQRERLRSVYLGQMPEEKTPSFEEKFAREVDHALGNVKRRTIVACIADGARSNWKYFESHPELKNAIHINDFWHSAEKLHVVSGALFGEKTAQADRWFKKYRHILKTKEGGVDSVIRSIRYYRKIRNIRSSRRLETIRRILRYFTRNRSRMMYAEYRRQGLPIGSGVIEAACKTLVGHRFKRAGMRWSIEGGQKILNLRAVVLSSRWDYFWRCHEEGLGADPVAA